jgi:hypothetical protein
MPIALEQLPSPLMGEGQYCSAQAQMLSLGVELVPPPRRGRAGWGCASAVPSGPTSPPIPTFPARGEGALTSPCELPH